MLRHLLVLLLLALAVGFPREATPEATYGAVSVEDACDCCPGTDAEDCCAWDTGACCPQAHLAVASPDAGPASPRGLAPEPADEVFTRELLLPRDNGPPPTPPPIA